MSLIAEHVPKHNWTGFAGEILDLKLLRPLDYLRTVCAGLAQASEIAFDVSHKNRHATRTKILRERLQRDPFAPCQSRPRSVRGGSPF